MRDMPRNCLAHLLTLTASRGALNTFTSCSLTLLLLVVVTEAIVHIRLNLLRMRKNIVDHLLVNRPPEEVELSDCGVCESSLPPDRELNAIPPAERIKESL